MSAASSSSASGGNGMLLPSSSPGECWKRLKLSVDRGGGTTDGRREASGCCGSELSVSGSESDSELSSSGPAVNLTRLDGRECLKVVRLAGSSPVGLTGGVGAREASPSPSPSSSLVSDVLTRGELVSESSGR